MQLPTSRYKASNPIGKIRRTQTMSLNDVAWSRRWD